MKIAAAALIELTDDLLATEQPIPQFLAAMWSDALAGHAPGTGPDDPDEWEPTPVLDGS